METNSAPARTANDVYNRPAAFDAVEFRPCEWHAGWIVIYSRRAERDIGILIPTGEGFRLALDKDLKTDAGGGLIFVWNGDPISLRFDLVTTSQAELDLQTRGGGR